MRVTITPYGIPWFYQCILQRKCGDRSNIILHVFESDVVGITKTVFHYYTSMTSCLIHMSSENLIFFPYLSLLLYHESSIFFAIQNWARMHSSSFSRGLFASSCMHKHRLAWKRTRQFFQSIERTFSRQCSHLDKWPSWKIMFGFSCNTRFEKITRCRLWKSVIFLFFFVKKIWNDDRGSFRLAFRGPVRSGFFPFWGWTGTVTGPKISKFRSNRTETAKNRSLSVFGGSVRFENRPESVFEQFLY